MNHSTENPENYHQAALDYAAYYYQQQQQVYDPSSHQSYHQPAIDSRYPYPYHHYGYSIPTDPNTTEPHQEQEPSPPGVSVVQQTDYYPYPTAALIQDVPAPYPPILQSSYGGIGTTDGPYPQESAVSHSGLNPNALARPSCGRGRGRGCGRSLGPGRTVRNPTGFSPQYGPQYSTSLGSVSSMSLPGQPRSACKGPIVFRCELCEVDCDTQEVLEIHQTGKKHHKNLKRLEETQLRQESQNECASTSGISVPMPVQAQPYPVVPIAQNANCELCKVECNSLEILQQHKKGKKHIRNMRAQELLQKHVKQCTVSLQNKEPPTSELSLAIHAKESSEVAVETPTVEPTDESGKNADRTESTEASGLNMRMDNSGGIKRKSMGVKVNKRNVRTSNGSKKLSQPHVETVPLICEVCNVKCDTQLVFQSHLIGKKHLLKSKRLFEGAGIFGQDLIKAITPAIQALYHPNYYYYHNATTSNAPLQFQDFGPFQGPLIPNLAPAIGTNIESISQAHILNTEGRSTEGNLVSQPGSSLDKPLTFGTLENGAHVAEQNVILTEGKD